MVCELRLSDSRSGYPSARYPILPGRDTLEASFGNRVDAMPEGNLTAILKPADSELFDSVQKFLETNTDGVRTERCSRTLTQLSGFIDSSIVDLIDAFASNLTDARFVRLMYSNEYGTEIFWVVDDGEIQRFDHEFEESSKRVVKAYEALHKGMGSVRVGWLTKAGVAEMKKETNDPRTPIYMDVLFPEVVSVDLDHHEYLDGYYPPRGVSSHDDYSWGHWFPIGSKSKKPEGLIQQLLEVVGHEFYARTYQDLSRTQRILHCRADGITELFNTDDYTDEELEYVRAHTDEKYGRAKWSNPDIGDLKELLYAGTLREYVDERAAAYRAEVAEEKRQLAELRAAHPDDRVPLLDGLILWILYQDLDEESVGDLMRTLQIRGMEKGGAETGLGLMKENNILVTTKLKPAGEWLIANIDALSNHEIEIDDREGPWDDISADDVNWITISMH